MVQVRKESFTGTLSIWDIDCTFSFFDEVYLEIKPMPSLIETFQEKCKEFRGNFDGMDWIHGISKEKSKTGGKSCPQTRQMGIKRVSGISRAQKPQRGKPRT